MTEQAFHSHGPAQACESRCPAHSTADTTPPPPGDATPAPRTIFIGLNVDWDFAPEEIFPDGVPENFTAADVAAAIKESGSTTAFLSEWGLTALSFDISCGPGDFAQVELT